MKQINIIGLFDKMVSLIKEPRQAIPWGIKAKNGNELLKPSKAPAAKKKHRKMVEQSRREKMKKRWYSVSRSRKWYPDEDIYGPEVKIRAHFEGKTLGELWEENDKKSGFFVMSPTNQTSKYELLSISPSKNLAILSHRGYGIRGYFKKYYDLFVLDNPRWFRV